MLRKLSRAARIARHRLVPHSLILLYHRITELANDPHLLAVDPDNFASHLDLIRRHATPVRLQELVEAVKGGGVVDRAVVVTFDDGYADNLHQAKPLLERLEVPATVFVTAGQVGAGHEFWWDELDRLLLQPGSLPPKVRLEFGERTIERDLGESAEYPPAAFWRDSDWHLEKDGRPTSRHSLFLELFAWFITLPDHGKQSLLADLREWAEVDWTGRVTHRTLTWEEVSHLREPGLVDIGAHTMTHPDLVRLTADEQEDEIQRCKERLESRLNTPVTHFAFPHGSYNPTTVTCVREAGFISSCTSHTAPVWKGADPLQLPRIGVRNWDGPTFERWFKWWMNG